MLRPDAEIRMLDGPHLVLQRLPAEAMRIIEDFLVRASMRARAAPQEISTA
jgi:hypothetical protein